MINIDSQIKLLKSKLHGGKVQYVLVPTREGGAVVMGITKGKTFNYALYRDNANYRRAK
jgi:hypothetical protein